MAAKLHAVTPKYVGGASLHIGMWSLAPSSSERVAHAVRADLTQGDNGWGESLHTPATATTDGSHSRDQKSLQIFGRFLSAHARCTSGRKLLGQVHGHAAAAAAVEAPSQGSGRRLRRNFSNIAASWEWKNEAMHMLTAAADRRQLTLVPKRMASIFVSDLWLRAV
uniref:Uncharacterized protein n=1 Tax=Tetraselmis sp. GSL018 TaxID=582737 RepID=A0A061SNM8_9CHLO